MTNKLLTHPKRLSLSRFLRFTTVWTVLLLFSFPLAASVHITSDEGNYSIEFPAQPKTEDQSGETFHGSTYLVVQDNVIYSSGCVIYNQDVPDASAELEANAANFTKAINAKITAKKSTRFSRGTGDELPALEFTAESEKLLCTGLSVVDGRHSYIVVGCALKPHKGQADIDRFVKSFKLSPKK
jgi:hypothetical protein